MMCHPVYGKNQLFLKSYSSRCLISISSFDVQQYYTGDYNSSVCNYKTIQTMNILADFNSEEDGSEEDGTDSFTDLV